LHLIYASQTQYKEPVNYMDSKTVPYELCVAMYTNRDESHNFIFVEGEREGESRGLVFKLPVCELSAFRGI